MLDDRKKKILQAIVEEYIETAEPVSSKALVQKHGIDYSSATIRNEMAELEKIGLIDKTHTSSGRIPSAQGYRYYVDELLNYNDISMQEIKYIQNQLEKKVNQIEDLTKIATTTLSEITHYTSVGIAPRVTTQNIQEVKFMLLGSRILMAVIFTESGLIKETIINNENVELLDDFFYINEVNQEKIQNEIVSLCKGRLRNFGNYDFFNNIQVITPTKKGKLGTKELNNLLQRELNPEEEEKNERTYGEVIFREQDRVMQTKNNYNILWEKENEREFKKELGNGIFNGELGRIERINKEAKTVRVKFDDGKIATYENTDLDQLEHAYSITVHKSQGSEFDVVILVAAQTAPMLLTRNLIYTAMTRAKKLLIVIGSQSVINYMISNNESRQRNTGLKFKLEKIAD